MAIRAKMKLQCIREEDFGNGNVMKQACFFTEYDESIPEDRRFCAATPTGTASFYIDNPAAIDQLVPGKAYYFDIVEVTEGGQ